MPSITPAMMDAYTIGEMAEAFHPSQRGEYTPVEHAIFDIAEAALLWSCARIPKRDFLRIVEES